MKTKKKITIFATITILIFLIFFLYDTYISTSYSSRHYKNVENSVKRYISIKYGHENTYYLSTHWNLHDFYMDNCKFYSEVIYLPSSLQFQVFSNGKEIIGDTFNKVRWEEKLNNDFLVLSKTIFGEKATSSFRFTFDYYKSSSEIDNLTNIITFNEYLDQDNYDTHERNDKLKLLIKPSKTFDLEVDISKINEILQYLNNIKINYGSVTFRFDDSVEKTYYYNTR